jgi:hypothetical protein
VGGEGPDSKNLERQATFWTAPNFLFADHTSLTWKVQRQQFLVYAWVSSWPK